MIRPVLSNRSTEINEHDVRGTGRSRHLLVNILGLIMLSWACSNDANSGNAVKQRNAPIGGSTTGGDTLPTCEVGSSQGAVAEPRYLMHLDGETSWYASPLVVDLDNDGNKELVAAYYSVFIYDEKGALLDTIEAGGDRVYAPHVVTDLEGDGISDIVFGSGSNVHAYEFVKGQAVLKSGWPASIDGAGTGPEVRGLAVGDLNRDGSMEIVVTTTETADEADGGSQVWVMNADGSLYQPKGIDYNAWPRYNAKKGEGNDADRNGQGHSGYGCYGLNVGIGNLDDDEELEIVATYDNHHIQVFDHDGVALNSSPWFTNRSNEFEGERMTYGQFIRWADPAVEEAHYHDHTGDWPSPSTEEWLQWTQSPPNIADLDGDGKNEVMGVPNVEMHEPYETQTWAIMVLEGAYGDGSRAAMRQSGWEELPRGKAPVIVDGWYPPTGVPAMATVNLSGDSALEIVVSLNDEYLSAFDASGHLLWTYNYSHGLPILFATEPTIADLNQDGSPEVLFATYGAPEVLNSGNLVILAANGSEVFDLPLPNPGENGNGNGAPAAPTVADWNGDGNLEIFVQTFEHGMDIYSVAGSSENCLLWSTARGGPLRMGQPSR
jgi:hypothetical protein